MRSHRKHVLRANGTGSSGHSCARGVDSRASTAKQTLSPWRAGGRRRGDFGATSDQALYKRHQWRDKASDDSRWRECAEDRQSGRHLRRCMDGNRRTNGRIEGPSLLVLNAANRAGRFAHEVLHRLNLVLLIARSEGPRPWILALGANWQVYVCHAIILRDSYALVLRHVLVH